MVHQIIDFVISVYKRSSIFWLRLRIPKESNHGVEMRDFANNFLRIDVNGLCLEFGNRAQGFDLSVVETSRYAECRKIDGGWIDSMQSAESTNGIMPPVSSLRNSLADVGKDGKEHIHFRPLLRSHARE